jgi:hypothetical protein
MIRSYPAPSFSSYANKGGDLGELQMKKEETTRIESTFIWNAALVFGLILGMSFGSVARSFYNVVYDAATSLDSLLQLEASKELD